MLAEILSIRNSLNKAYLRVKPIRSGIEHFKSYISELISHSNSTESEEHHKNIIATFLKKTWYDPDHYINTKGRTDLVIHNGKDSKSPVGVIIETKRPGSKSEMPSRENLNVKAVHELILYYLRERITDKNLEIKHLIATDLNEWYIFNAQEFERLFASNKNLVKDFEQFEEGSLSGTKTDFFYHEIAKPFLENLDQQIQVTHFNITDFKEIIDNSDNKDDNKLIGLYKIFSPEHLLKMPFSNDSNTLDRKFYSELLHIIGLEETKDGGKKIIGRKAEKTRNGDSLLENTINILKYEDSLNQLPKRTEFGETQEEQLYSVALELCITWLNRILFLKLLEGQLIRYHNGDENYKFLNPALIPEYDALNKLFFHVLAVKESDRNEKIRNIFGHVPYLNSSLFELTELEQKTIRISNLDDNSIIPILSGTVLKDSSGNKVKGEEKTLHYLLKFLDSYDFSSEGKEEISEENKTLINASVLGLIFEKINGYKDGSFFTPGFITMYMCRETIRRAVIQKFNEALAAGNLKDQHSNTHPQPLSRGELSTNEDNLSEKSPLFPDSPELPGTTPLSRGAGGVFPLSRKSGGVSRREIIPYNPNLKKLARDLRNNSTHSEIILWTQLKGKFEGKYDFHRQKPLDNYIADFFCHELRLVIEIDGITHDWEETQKKDYKKECRLNELGLNVLRFTDDDVINNLDVPVNAIIRYIEGFEKGDLSGFKYEDTPLNPLSGGDFSTFAEGIEDEDEAGFEGNQKSGEDTPLNPLSGGDFSTSQEDLDDDISGFEGNSNSLLAPDSLPTDRSTPLSRGAGGVFPPAEHVVLSSIEDVYNSISETGPITRQQANTIINSLKICDPAVGSGHFLVSALNEIIAIKSELKILTDRKGKILRDYNIEVINDELVITDEDGEFFEYHPKNPESRRIQETLFHEKQTIIENCLFGVDINPNSVKICRLRLWIELLKNAYYKEVSPPTDGPTPLSRGAGGVSSRGAGGVSVLETLPNIDINIKCGNSLISRYPLDADIKKALQRSRWTIDSYRAAVMTYRNAENKDQKTEMRRLIAQIKSDFESEVAMNDKRLLKLNKLKGELMNLTSQTSLFRLSQKEKAEWNAKVKKATEEITKIEKELEEIKNNKIYEHAFEWRFEFPEVLNDEGDFVGFDVVIGNPPYVDIKAINIEQVKYYFSEFKTTSNRINLYSIFVELSYRLLRNKGEFIYIIPNSILINSSYQSIRNLISNELRSIVKLPDKVFPDAIVETIILSFQKDKNSDSINVIRYSNDDQISTVDTSLTYQVKKSIWQFFIEPKFNIYLTDEIQTILIKCHQNSVKLGDIANFSLGITPYDKYQGHEQSLIENREFHSPIKLDDLYKPLIQGENIIRFKVLEEIKEFIKYGVWLGAARDESFFTKPRVIVRQIVSGKPPRIYAGYTEKPLYFTQIGFGIISHKIISSKALTALLNSKLFNFIHKYLYLDIEKELFQKILIENCKQFPIRQFDENSLSKLETIIDYILSNKMDVLTAEIEIDKMIYGIYGLTEEEIIIIEEG